MRFLPFHLPTIIMRTIEANIRRTKVLNELNVRFGRRIECVRVYLSYLFAHMLYLVAFKTTKNVIRADKHAHTHTTNTEALSLSAKGTNHTETTHSSTLTAY